MKKHFKTPTEAQKSNYKNVAKIIKKMVQTPPPEPVQFLCKAEFDYSAEGGTPFLYLGELTTAWKQYAKQVKKDKDFMAGYAKIDTKAGKLLLQVSSGKGDKPAFINEVNKKLLKPSSITVELVDKLEAQIIDEEQDSPEEIKAKKEAETYALSVNSQLDNFYANLEQGNLIDPRQMNENLQQLQQSYKNWLVLAKKNKYAQEGAKVMHEILSDVGTQWKALKPFAVAYYKKDQELEKAIKSNNTTQILQLMQELQQLSNKITQL